ncbi:Fe(2+) transporter permease subunit FeoB [Phaeovibrio sulfidiphilus]|uniref:Ferrous iron transport protein B n=1 Tax=Phaeovibrio sulfidiphilus TaxID=1220600 RepID=A0A8J6YLG3_9PROT|nr:Fe(2+) transporter permease subunit FeoB [Phaeovibrio sulfidiphilus]MBE1236940.1 Fe(2+) transporter permease subunit FeoB [Phaeovibrio sulfidiphilus]
MVSTKRTDPKILRTVALIGPPNSGKSSVFNRLTGASQRVGNFPGITVERMEGMCRADGKCISVVDLPGLYSIAPNEAGSSLDYEVARKYVGSCEADLFLNIADATRLEQSLYLTVQLLECGVPCIVALNMMDAAEDAGLQIDVDALARRLGCPVFPVSAASGSGIRELRERLFEALPELPRTSPVTHSASVEAAVSEVVHELDTRPDAYAPGSHRWVALSMLEGDHSLLARNSADLGAFVAEKRRAVEDAAGDDVDTLIAAARFDAAHSLVESTVVRGKARSVNHTDSIDSVVLHPLLGIPVFFFVMYLMFMFTVHIGGAFIDFFDVAGATIFVDGFGHLLESIGAPEWLVVLLAKGIGGGITTVATFVPIVGALYLALTVLEDSGYMARAAFVMDKAMNRIGLPGKAIVPLIVGFGCNVPAVMAARVMERPKDRVLAITMAPFMSCGARLAVYALFATAFFPKTGGMVVMALYLIGIAAAIFTAMTLKKTILAGDAAPFMLELPSYRMPRLRDVLIHSWTRLKVFVMGAGKVIVAVVMVISVLQTMGTDGKFDHEGKDSSILAQVSQVATPAFGPMGLSEDNWPAMVGIVTGLFAKEAVVGTLNTLYAAQADQAGDADQEGAAIVGEEESEDEAFDFWGGIQEAFMTIPEKFASLGDMLLDPLGISDGLQDEEALATASEFSGPLASGFAGPLAAFSYLLFVLLYVPCAAVLGAVKRELGWGWTGFVTFWTTGLAYIVATSTYQIGTFSQHPLFSGLWLLGCLGVMVVSIGSLSLIGRHQRASAALSVGTAGTLSPKGAE